MTSADQERSRADDRHHQRDAEQDLGAVVRRDRAEAAEERHREPGEGQDDGLDGRRKPLPRRRARQVGHVRTSSANRAAGASPGRRATNHQA